MSRKRLTVTISDLGFGGAQNMAYEQLKHMDSNKFDISVLCCGPKRGAPLEGKMEKLYPVTYLGHYGRVTPLTICKVLVAIQRTKPDVVHSHIGADGFAAMWARVFRKPLVITVHAKPEKAFSEKTKKQVRALLKSRKIKLVAVSEDNAKLVKEYYKLTDSQSDCVNNGIDLDRFARKSHEGFTIIHVGRQDENKNQAALIRCFARLYEKYSDAKLLLLGDGPLHQELINLVAEMNLQDVVTLTGNVANTEDYYAVSDLYVQCSHREAMPLSVLEAMATGLPIISTDVGGLRDVVQDNGILVPDNDEDALYKAIERIYEQSEEEIKTMCAASNRIVQKYSSKEMAREYEKIYSEMCK